MLPCEHIWTSRTIAWNVSHLYEAFPYYGQAFLYTHLIDANLFSLSCLSSSKQHHKSLIQCKMRSLSFILLYSLALIFPGALAQCPASYSATYTDANNEPYALYCGYDTTPGAYLTTTAATLPACLALCDADAACGVVTFASGGICYLKRSVTGVTANSNLNSAVKLPPYPAPVAGNINQSGGCGNSLPSYITQGITATSVSFTTADGLTRIYNIRVPLLYDATKAAPLIMAFHGKSSNSHDHEAESGYSFQGWNPYGIVVYPQGYTQSGSAVWEGDPSTVVKGVLAVDDQSFVSALLANLTSTYCIDTGRVFATGMSNGGGFTGVMACNSTMVNKFAAFAPHSGAFYPNTTVNAQGTCTGTSDPYSVVDNNIIQSVCSPGKTVPMMEFHGDIDTQIPYFGGPHYSYCLAAVPHFMTDW